MDRDRFEQIIILEEEEEPDSYPRPHDPVSEALARLETPEPQEPERPMRAARALTSHGNRRHERPDRHEKPERPENLEKLEMPEASEKPLPPDRPERPRKSDIPEPLFFYNEKDVPQSSAFSEIDVNSGPLWPTASFGSNDSWPTSAGTEFFGQRYFQSRRSKKGTVSQPWVNKTHPKEKWTTIIPLMGIVVGLGLSAFLIWDGVRSVAHHKYCPILDENFSEGLDESVWTKEAEVGGFGSGQFQQTTTGENNVYIESGRLILKAEPQDSRLIEKNNIIDLNKDKTCTGTGWVNCRTGTNITNGTIVPPARSGRINTKKGAQIKYGRVEVTARFPRGDWLWPIITMLPVDNKYGEWPRSGQIDIAQSRGNNHTYAQGGDNIVNSAIHWGPSPANDAWWKTNGKRHALHTTYSAGFNTFGLEWSEKYLFTYVNGKLLQVSYTNFNKPMWKRGGFPETAANGTRLVDPWTETGQLNAPFDQKFYLVLSLAVGGINGWFQDGASDKPWVDNSTTAKKEFWSARSQWEPTWTRPTLEISRVKIMQQCDGNEDL